jgi:class 3 adenylate cyclase
MFTDLVGATARSTKLDPEDIRAVIGAYHKCVAETVARFDGFVAKHMAGGVLIYFGYPRVCEDDAESAMYGPAWHSPKRSASCASKSRATTGLVAVRDLVSWEPRNIRS